MAADVLVLAGFGINCEAETAHAFSLAGGTPRIAHLNDVITDPALLDAVQIFAVPGGFSFGDDVASGRILANRIRYRLAEPLNRFVAAGKLAIGICNGFQVLVKMGLLPRLSGSMQQEVTLTHNDSGRFEDRWVELRRDPNTACVWLKDIDAIALPVRHGEGKFAAPEDVVSQLETNGCVALRYADNGKVAGGAYPANPNGSLADVAGICDTSGRIFGLMPHPEAFIDRTHHPQWTRLNLAEEGAGLAIFRNGVRAASERLEHV